MYRPGGGEIDAGWTQESLTEVSSPAVCARRESRNITLLNVAGVPDRDFNRKKNDVSTFSLPSTFISLSLTEGKKKI